MPQRQAIAGEQHPEDLGIARQSFELRGGDRSRAGNLAPAARVSTRDDVRVCHDHDLVAEARPRGDRCAPLGHHGPAGMRVSGAIIAAHGCATGCVGGGPGQME